MAEEKKKQEEQKNQEVQQETKLSETWAQDALGDLEDWIEEQGIYIRQLFIVKYKCRKLQSKM